LTKDKQTVRIAVFEIEQSPADVPSIPPELSAAMLPLVRSRPLAAGAPSPACAPARRAGWLAPLLAAAVLAMAVLGGAGSAQATPAATLRFHKLMAPGFDNPSVISLLQDRQGFVWIGTSAGGLYRYDGYQALHYLNRPGDPRSLPHDRVSAVYQDRQGTIWVATQNGMARYNAASNDFTPFAPPAGPNNYRIVKTIVSDGKDGMWLGTWGGVQHFDPASGQFTSYVHEADKPGSLAWNDTNALAPDSRGGLWVATWPSGIDYLAPGARTFQHFRIDTESAPNAKLNVARALHFDRRGRLWMGTEAGVVRWDPARDWRTREQLTAPPSRITNIYSDRDGTVWVATLNAGLMHWNEDKAVFERFLHYGNDEYSLPADHIQALMQDSSGMLWAGSYTDGIGLANLNSHGFTRYLPHDFGGEREDEHSRPASNAMNAMADGGDGRLWLGGSSGISLFDPASGKVQKDYRPGPGRRGSLSDILVYSLYRAKNGPLWVGTSGGLNRLDRIDGPFTTVDFGTLANNYINAIAPGSGGSLWLGTGSALIHYDPASDARRIYLHDKADPDSRSINGSTVVLEDRGGRVWVGSEWNGGGLDLLDQRSGKFRHFRHAAGDSTTLSDDNVTSLYEDGQGRLWVGTAKGLNRVSVGASGAIAVQPVAALGFAKVFAIHADRQGKIWVSTNAGLSRLDPDSGTSSQFTATDGISDGFLSGSALGMDNGRLYFGGVRGFTAIDPDKVSSLSVAPQVAITNISVFNRSLRDGIADPDVELRGTVSAPTALTLSWRASVFSFEFAAPHFTDPGRNRYAYRLQGFDRDWVDADAAHRSASYTNLNPGKYVFRVKASNDRGVWSEAISLPVTIRPPWWSRWWFRLGAALATLAALAGVYRWRIARLTHHQARLEALVAVRTEELQESNRKLAALSTTDGLTGIANRRGFDIALEAEWRRAARNGQPLALCMMDVDFFKKYNDHYGHQQGDEALRAVARLIGEHARRTSDLVARYGGEEFALLAAATTAEDALALALTLCADLQKLAMPHAQSPFGVVTISIGVASMTPGDGVEPERLLREADRAMYRAKVAGRNRALAAEQDAEDETVPVMRAL
jgi:diguanylate cyclase (GGDEF)-like protein